MFQYSFSYLWIIDGQDPYILRTHLGTLECRLCLTLHVNEGSYLAHTQGKKHQTNLARRAAQDNKSQSLLIAPAPAANQVKKKVFVKIGRPGESSQSRQGLPSNAPSRKAGVGWMDLMFLLDSANV